MLAQVMVVVALAAMKSRLQHIKGWVSKHGLKKPEQNFAFVEVVGGCVKAFWGCFNGILGLFSIILHYFTLFYVILHYFTLFYLHV